MRCNHKNQGDLERQINAEDSGEFMLLNKRNVNEIYIRIPEEDEITYGMQRMNMNDINGRTNGGRRRRRKKTCKKRRRRTYRRTRMY